MAARYPVLIAAAFYTAADEDLDFLIDYAQAGGHLVVGPRTGYGDREGRARTERAPARITDAAGVWYDEMATLPSPVAVHGSLQGAATGFAEGPGTSGCSAATKHMTRARRSGERTDPRPSHTRRWGPGRQKSAARLVHRPRRQLRRAGIGRTCTSKHAVSLSRRPLTASPAAIRW